VGVAKVKTRIHVNQFHIKANRKNEDKMPVLTAMTYKGNTYCNHIEILDKDGNVAATIVYSPDKPLDSGARVWIETTNEVRTK
jgi:hypothetical protein